MNKKIGLVWLLAFISILFCACGKPGVPAGPTGQEEASPTAGGITPEITEAPDEIKRSLSFLGNTVRLQRFIEKAQKGDKLTIACIGGSITEGYTVKKSECYASLLKELVSSKYSNSDIKLVNAGISGTPSNLGLMRLQTDVLSQNPDLIVVEFAVNDAQDVITKMMFDSLIHDCMLSENAPAVIILLTVTEQGYSCEAQMTSVAKAYEVPVINVKSAIWPEIQAGNMKYTDYSNDGVHPNPDGHKRIQTYFDYLLDCAKAASPTAEVDYNTVHAFSPSFSGMKLYTADKLDPDALGGFRPAASGIGNFSDGWAWTKKSSDGGMKFTFTGKDLFLIYTSNNNAKFGSIEVYVDNVLVKRVDSNEPTGWGGANYVTILNKSEAEKHKVEIIVPEASLDKSFQLVGIATTGEIEGGHLIPEEELPYTERAVVSMGNLERLQKLFARAEAGESLTLGFIGGSITMGSGASNSNKCYANLVYDWFVKRFPKADFTYLNAGIGATDSQFACARLEDDLLRYAPDFVIVEFSVNDSSSAEYKESYECLIRRILESDSEPAVLTLNMVQYDNGVSAQTIHNLVAKHYGLPIVSMKNSIYKEITLGNLKASDISADNLHPNDRGHAYACEIVSYYLEKAANAPAETDNYSIPEKMLTDGSWLKAERINSINANVELKGFTEDTAKQNGITDIFKNGYYARKAGDSLSFTVYGTEIYVQYRKSNSLGAPKALVIIDGDESKAVEIDGNFPNGWGNWLKLDKVYTGTEAAEHRVEIRITEPGSKQDLYIVSLIVK